MEARCRTTTILPAPRNGDRGARNSKVPRAATGTRLPAARAGLPRAALRTPSAVAVTALSDMRLSGVRRAGSPPSTSIVRRRTGLRLMRHLDLFGRPQQHFEIDGLGAAVLDPYHLRAQPLDLDHLV